jgi:hypothetical protein
MMNQTAYDPDTIHTRLRDSVSQRRAEKRDEDLARVRKAFIDKLDDVDVMTWSFDIFRSDTDGVDGPLLYEYASQVAAEFNQMAEKYEYSVRQYSTSYVAVSIREKGTLGIIPLLLAILLVTLYGLYTLIRRKRKVSSQNRE